jgi:hypothetical protein
LIQRFLSPAANRDALSIGSLNCSASGDQLDHEHDERDHEQYVYKSAEGVRSNNPEQPQHKKNYKDCPKHQKTSLAVRVLPQALNL